MKIGVFDSGVGGLTVLKALTERFPHAQFVYIGDMAHVPYGNKSPQTVIRYSRVLTKFLVEQNVDAVVIACNTASALAHETLKNEFKLPIFEVIGPAVSAAARATKNNTVGVIGTSATIQSQAYQKTAQADYPEMKLSATACPLLVPLVEEGLLVHPATTQIVKLYLEPIAKSAIDTLILGCTHYPLLEPVIASIMGSKVTLINSAQAVAEHVDTSLPDTQDDGEQTIQLFATDSPERLRSFAEHIFNVREFEAELLQLDSL